MSNRSQNFLQAMSLSSFHCFPFFASDAVSLVVMSTLCMYILIHERLRLAAN